MYGPPCVNQTKTAQQVMHTWRVQSTTDVQGFWGPITGDTIKGDHSFCRDLVVVLVGRLQSDIATHQVMELGALAEHID